MSDDDEYLYFWPIPEEGQSDKQSKNLLTALANAKIETSVYVEDGTKYSDDLYVTLSDWMFLTETEFQRVKLIDLLVEELNWHDIEDVNVEINAEDNFGYFLNTRGEQEAAKAEKLIRLFVRLVRAYQEWQENDLSLSWQELVSTPLPSRENSSTGAAGGGGGGD